ncbi:MAG: replication-relaxation family protein [Actinobacteria bacterium]|nr:replication-relaxation family protein [Actinomycetota bacterium]
MTTVSTAHAGHRGLPPAAIDIVASVAAHRALSAEQIRVIHLPGTGPRRCRALLARIGAAGLIAHVSTGVGSPRRLWFATEAGVRAAVEVGVLPRTPRIFDAGEIVGPLRAHTFAVNEAAISFLEAAREEGDDFGPLAWRHEVGHPLSRPARRGRSVIADAVLTYVRTTAGKVYVDHRFLELDRATLAVDGLAAELARYADLFRAEDPEEGGPLWRRRYPAFPSVVCMLAGAGREMLLRRRDTALALLRAEPQLTRTPKVEIRVCLLEDLVAEGPFAPIFRALRDPGQDVDWLGNRNEEGST